MAFFFFGGADEACGSSAFRRARSSAFSLSVTLSGPSDITGGGTTGEAGRAGSSRSAAVDAGCWASEEERSAMTCCAFSFTAPVWRASDYAFCYFSSQSLARANETGSRGAGLSDEWCGCFLSVVQRSLYCCSRVLTVTLTRPLWGIACHNSSQTASMLLLKSGGTQVESPPRARRRDTLRRRPRVASGSGTLFQAASAVVGSLRG